MKSNSPNILVLDIETKPMLSFHWRMFKENIGIDQVVDPGGILCFGAKWLGDKDCMFYSEWKHGTKKMLQAAHKLMSEADAIITYNGDRFDLPKLNGEFVLYGLSPVGQTTSIDVYKTVKKLGYASNKLAFIGPFLQLGKKVEHEGFGLWKSVVLEKCPKARERMTTYCIGDVELLEDVYVKLAPYITNHPHLAADGPSSCGVCGGIHLHSRGRRRTKAYSIQRLQCQGCGAWQDGKREKLK